MEWIINKKDDVYVISNPILCDKKSVNLTSFSKIYRNFPHLNKLIFFIKNIKNVGSRSFNIEMDLVDNNNEYIEKKHNLPSDIIKIIGINRCNNIKNEEIKFDITFNFLTTSFKLKKEKFKLNLKVFDNTDKGKCLFDLTSPLFLIKSRLNTNKTPKKKNEFLNKIQKNIINFKINDNKKQDTKKEIQFVNENYYYSNIINNINNNVEFINSLNFGKF